VTITLTNEERINLENTVYDLAKSLLINIYEVWGKDLLPPMTVIHLIETAALAVVTELEARQ